MSDVEEKILENFDLKPYVWRGYIYIFFIWQHGVETLNAFIKSLNEFDSTIKLTVDNSEKPTEFLDVTINIKNGVLKTGLFVTPTNTHQYLESSSCHPYHCKKGILYSQALWLNKMYRHFFFWQEM